MKVLGICLNDINTSAAAVVDGRVVAAAREERFSREKYSRRFPTQALAYCLEETGLALDDFDAIAAPVNPAHYLEAPSAPQMERARFRGELLYAYPGFLESVSPLDATNGSVLTLRGLETERRIHYVTHHDAHAALAFHGSGFERAAVLTVDAFAEKDTSVFYDGENGRLTRLGQVRFPHSLGCFYASITEYLGLRPYIDEWKIMGAAALGDPEALLGEMRKLLWATEGLDFRMHLDAFTHYLFHRPGLFGADLVDRLGPAYGRHDERDDRFLDVAAAAQRVLEEVVLELVTRLVERTGKRDLCLSGGVAMNCVLNGKVVEQTPVDRLFVPAMPDDSGGSIGAAVAVARELGEPRIEAFEHAYLGPEPRRDEIADLLESCGLARHEVEDPATAAAELVAAGRVVGWCQGRMEFGDRALGARSILADPRNVQIAERIRRTVKPREDFQPFAPAVPEERAAEFFEGDLPAPFMERTVRTRPEHRETLAAVTHADGSARVQTVSRTTNPVFHRLLSELGSRIGVPVALNTSFNVSGEPIVATPADAIRSFYGSGIDALVLGPFLLTKD